MADLYATLAEWYPDGNYSEQELWDAIAEVHGVDVNEIMDGDLVEYLQKGCNSVSSILVRNIICILIFNLLGSKIIGS